MANPSEFTLFSSMSASASFTTQFAILNHQLASVHVVYANLSTDTGTINVNASNDILARTAASTAAWAPLEPEVTTLTSAFSSILFRIPAADTAFVQFEYKANSNTTGSMSAYAVLKSYT